MRIRANDGGEAVVVNIEGLHDALSDLLHNCFGKLKEIEKSR